MEVRASSLNKADWYDLTAPFPLRLIAGGGIRKPRNEWMGGDVAGRVESVGPNVNRFKPGDEVYGVGRGTLAEFAIAREGRLALKPANLSFSEAAAVPIAGLTALQGLRKGMVEPGHRVLIDGGSGGVGTFAVQIARAMGAEVTAVCSEKNLDEARRLGADHVIDYSAEDFTKAEERYDLIFGVNGFHSPFAYRRALTPKGRYLMAGSHKVLSALVQVAVLGPLLSRKAGKHLGFMGIAKVVPEDLASLKELIEAGKVRPFVEKEYPLNAAAEAFRFFGEGHARGKVVVTVGPPP